MIVRASTPLLTAKYKVIGVAVLDVVEGMLMKFIYILTSSPMVFRIHIRCITSYA